jgi:bidirectional [NiFe] hydrogenase diaphorase subunit
MENVKLEIDGKLVEAEPGMTILQAARKAGIDIPTLCYSEKMTPYGGCRLCTVELVRNGKSRLVASCVYPVEKDLVVKTETERVIKIRRMILELLLPRCPTGPIKSLAEKYGLEESRFEGEDTGCVLCGLCTRYCAEIKKENAIGFMGRGVERDVAFLPEVASKVCPTCRECFTVCPGGKIVKDGINAGL